MATRWELIANEKTVEEIRRHIGADSLGYLSIDGLMRAIGQSRDTFCTACFTGDYPLPVQLQMDKLVFERPSPGGRHQPALTAWSWERDRR
jgi:amidophosphoribosyltransferase